MNLTATSLCAALLLAALASTHSPSPAAPVAPDARDLPRASITNPAIDYASFLEIASATEAVREQRRLTPEEFTAKMREPGVVVLDARSADKFALRHVRGAVNLPFTDFTAETLARVIPAKDTPVLIYCNNNFRGDPVALATKAAPASLNISTQIALATYGYTNVHELGPLLDVGNSPLELTSALR
jgi:phage shock protein E